jgi:hypothetical protein
VWRCSRASPTAADFSIHAFTLRVATSFAAEVSDLGYNAVDFFLYATGLQ